jgi:hypothetical protein
VEEVAAERALLQRSVLVAERPRRVDVLWGFLTLVFGAALVRGHLGAGTTIGRVAVDVAFGALLGGSISAWVWFRRHPARLEITPEAVVFAHRGQRGAVRLAAPGELYIHTTHLGTTDRLHFLKVHGSDESIPLQMFDHEEVKAACRASGWRLAGDPHERLP